MPVNALVATVSLIILLQHGTPIGAGNGFFYARADRLFLVTTQHLCCNEQARVRPDTLRLLLHTDPHDVTQQASFDVPLYHGEERLWHGHATHPEADLALIELNKAEIQKRFFVRAWSQESLLPHASRFEPGDDVLVLGYPLLVRDERQKLPIFRYAMAASTYRVLFRGQPLFLTDAPLPPETSGSPVITELQNAGGSDTGNTKLSPETMYYLVGVHSGGVDPQLTGDKGLKLGAAWDAELVEDIAAQF